MAPPPNLTQLSHHLNTPTCSAMVCDLERDARWSGASAQCNHRKRPHKKKRHGMREAPMHLLGSTLWLRQFLMRSFAASRQVARLCPAGADEAGVVRAASNLLTAGAREPH
jgi:hypothetical protein